MFKYFLFRNLIRRNCPDIVNKFAPYAIEKILPNSYTRDKKTLKALCNQYEPVPVVELDLNHQFPTIVLVGPTQAGKSYLANMLLGVKLPGKCSLKSGQSRDKIPKDCKFISGEFDQKNCEYKLQKTYRFFK